MAQKALSWFGGIAVAGALLFGAYRVGYQAGGRDKEAELESAALGAVENIMRDSLGAAKDIINAVDAPRGEACEARLEAARNEIEDLRRRRGDR